MKKEIYSHYCTLHDNGPYSLEVFCNQVSEIFEEQKKACNENAHILTRFEIKFKQEWDYGESSAVIQLKIYRLETDKEAEDRKNREEKMKLGREKQKASKALNYKKKKLAEEVLLKNPEYQQFLALEKKFK